MSVFTRRHLALALAFACPALWAAEAPKIALPAPQLTGGKALMQALKERKSSREFAPEPLPLQTLSNLLWAAAGENRAGGQRTAPSALNAQEVDVYAVLPQGAYLYKAKGHTLEAVVAGDLRGKTGSQPFVASAPLNLVYVADFARLRSGTAEEKVLYSSAGAGFISENVYLFCASEGLATVVRGMVDRAALASALNLRLEQRVVLAQTVGKPAR